MARIIEALSPGMRPPDEPERLKAAYQAALTGKRALLLLDNATDRRQVAPLLPPAPVALLVTSRQRILLQGARSLELRTLPPGERSSTPTRHGAGREGGRRDARHDRPTLRPPAPRAPGRRQLLAGASVMDRRGVSGALADERTGLEALAAPEAEIDVKAVARAQLCRLKDEDPSSPPPGPSCRFSPPASTARRQPPSGSRTFRHP